MLAEISHMILYEREDYDVSNQEIYQNHKPIFIVGIYELIK